MNDLKIDANGDLTPVELDLVALVERMERYGATQLRMPRVFKHEWVPLQRTNAETGETEEALFWKIDGDIYVHPDRWEAFMAAMKAAGVEIR